MFFYWFKTVRARRDSRACSLNTELEMCNKITYIITGKASNNNIHHLDLTFTPKIMPGINVVIVVILPSNL